MKELTCYPLERTPALVCACTYLEERGMRIAGQPDEHVTHLLLPIPKYDETALRMARPRLCSDVTLVGGNLAEGIDFLKDARYLAENAAITADCAIRIAAQQLKTVFAGCPVLVIGWGRIGKCLAAQLKAMGAETAVSARKESDLAALVSLGYHAEETEKLGQCLLRYRVIFNTIPAEVLSKEQVSHCRADCIKIDLASKKGIAGEDVIWARGLPGKMAPEAAGGLIGRTMLRLIREEAAK